MIEFRKIEDLPEEICDIITNLRMEKDTTFKDYQSVIDGSDEESTYIIYTNDNCLQRFKDAVTKVSKTYLDINGSTTDFRHLPNVLLMMAEFVIIDGVVKKNRLGFRSEDEKYEAVKFMLDHKMFI